MSRSITAHLSGDLARFAEAEIAAGRFTDMDGVLDAGLAMLRKRQEGHEAKRAAIDAALEEGEKSGMFEGDPFASVRAELGLPKHSTTHG